MVCIPSTHFNPEGDIVESSISPIPSVPCDDSPNQSPFSKTAPLPVSLFGVLTTFILLFLLVWIVFRRHLAALPGISKKKIFTAIGIFALCVGCGVSWHILHDLYQRITPLASEAPATDMLTLSISNPLGTTYGDLVGICIPVILLLLAVLIGRAGKKVLSLPVRRNSKKMALVLYPLTLLGIALAFPALIIIESTITGSGGYSPHITHVVISALALTVSVYALGIVLCTKHLAAIFKTTQKKNIILILGAVALGIGGLSTPLYYNFNIFYSSFILVSIISSLIPLCILVCIGIRKLCRAALQLPVKKQSLKLAYSIYPLIAFALFAVLWILMAYLRAVFG